MYGTIGVCVSDSVEHTGTRELLLSIEESCVCVCVCVRVCGG